MFTCICSSCSNLLSLTPNPHQGFFICNVSKAPYCFFLLRILHFFNQMRNSFLYSHPPGHQISCHWKKKKKRKGKRKRQTPAEKPAVRDVPPCSVSAKALSLGTVLLHAKDNTPRASPLSRARPSCGTMGNRLCPNQPQGFYSLTDFLLWYAAQSEQPGLSASHARLLAPHKSVQISINILFHMAVVR